jgi:hypothetical protein
MERNINEERMVLKGIEGSVFEGLNLYEFDESEYSEKLDEVVDKMNELMELMEKLFDIVK